MAKVFGNFTGLSLSGILKALFDIGVEGTPSASPSATPSASPSVSPSYSPSASPSEGTPSSSPSGSPSGSPSEGTPSVSPSSSPSASPSEGTPSGSPSITPSASPSVSPSGSPSGSPSEGTPSASPSASPSGSPSGSTSASPSGFIDEINISITEDRGFYTLTSSGTLAAGTIIGYSWNIYEDTSTSGDGTGPWSSWWSSSTGLDQNTRVIAFNEEGYYKVESFIYGTLYNLTTYSIEYIDSLALTNMDTIYIDSPNMTVIGIITTPEIHSRDE